MFSMIKRACDVLVAECCLRVSKHESQAIENKAADGHRLREARHRHERTDKTVQYLLDAARTIAPTLRYSQSWYEEALKRYVTPSVEWVEIGCGHSILPSWRINEERQLVKTCKAIFGIDYDLPSLKAHPNIYEETARRCHQVAFQE